MWRWILVIGLCLLAMVAYGICYGLYTTARFLGLRSLARFFRKAIRADSQEELS